MSLKDKTGGCWDYEFSAAKKACSRLHGRGVANPYETDSFCTMMVKVQDVVEVASFPSHIKSLPGMAAISGTGTVVVFCDLLKRTICVKGTDGDCRAAGGCGSLCKVKKKVTCKNICQALVGSPYSKDPDKRKYWHYYLKYRHTRWDRQKCSEQLCQANNGHVGRMMCTQVARMY